MTQAGDKGKHLSSAARALSVYQAACGTVEDHAIADLICDLGHLSEELGIDFLAQLQRGVQHWHVERRPGPGALAASDPVVKIVIRAK
jgi:hypothetical protein